VTVLVQQVAYAAQKLDVFGTVIASPATALQRPDLGKLALPEPQDVLRNVKFLRHLADGTEGCGGLLYAARHGFRARVGLRRSGAGAAGALRRAHDPTPASAPATPA